MSRRRFVADELTGALIVDKPAGQTSHDVVAKLRRQLNERRIGHAGTLDPSATGVLVVGIGRATRLMRFVVGADKTYTGEIVLGTTTTTEDADGEVVAHYSMSQLELEDVQAAASSLTGPIKQIPPMVSAIKVDGKRLHELARAGIEVEREPRDVVISRFDITATDRPGVYGFVVDCSSGTYVRTLAADLGLALGGGAHLGLLRRTRVGSFTLDDAVVLEDATRDAVQPARLLVRGLPGISVTEDVVAAIKNGKPLEGAALGFEGGGPVALLDDEGVLLAVYAPWRSGLLKPDVVFAVDTPSS